MAHQHLCKFHDIPEIEGMPKGTAWGYYAPEDKKKTDALGRLNLLTPELIKKTVAEQVKTGQRVSLDWSLENTKFPGFQRQPLKQTIIDLTKLNIGWVGTDDEITLNTQCGSQWDGFRHVAHLQSRRFYNDGKQEDFETSDVLGINHWVDAGGIAGRGVLLDWVRWKEQTQPNEPLPSPITRHEIPHEELIEVAKYQGTSFEAGDILIVRTGFVRWHDKATDDERKAATRDASNFIGVKATMGAVEFFWDNHFAAVACDVVAFEAWPPQGDVLLHEWLIAMSGCPIGEMWDLEKLSKMCEQEKRWTFFFTSAPLKVPGGVGSPPNAIAFF